MLSRTDIKGACGKMHFFNIPTPQFQAEAALRHAEGGVERGRHESSIQRSGSSSAEGISCQFCSVHWIRVDNKGHCVYFLIR